MEQSDIQGKDQDELINLISIYGEAYLIRYLIENILEKEKIINLNEDI